MEITRQWQSDRRFYSVKLYQDLLGDVVIESRWGGRYNRLGGTSTLPVPNIEEGIKLLDQLHIDRLRKNYRSISD